MNRGALGAIIFVAGRILRVALESAFSIGLKWNLPTGYIGAQYMQAQTGKCSMADGSACDASALADYRPALAAAAVTATNEEARRMFEIHKSILRLIGYRYFEERRSSPVVKQYG